jgi:hypothetical protein
MNLVAGAKKFLTDIGLFSRFVTRRPLRKYQQWAASAILDSVLNQRGLTFAVMFPRQAGKNETQAQIEAYLLNLFQRVPGAQIVKASPTFKPQTINSLMRLATMLDNAWNVGQWNREQGYIMRLGKARVLFFSAEPSAKVVGASATVLLECDEAQDVDAAKWQKDFMPMVASTNATRVLWGTAWTSQTLLANTIKDLQLLEQKDLIKRVFIISPEMVAEEVAEYGTFVAGEVARLGRDHPMVKTQFFLETIDAQGGLFTATRRAAMHGSHDAQDYPTPGAIYAFLVDVGGADEEQLAGSSSAEPVDAGSRRDSTSLTIVLIDLATLANPQRRAPTYRVMYRLTWTNTAQPDLYNQLSNLAETWKPAYLVIDATGLGQGLAGFLGRRFLNRVIPFIFTSASKSKLGWDFLALIDSGRFQDFAPPHTAQSLMDQWDLQEVFFQQLLYTQYEVVPGPGKTLKWAVPNGSRDPNTGAYLHDDLVMSAALVTILDTLPWRVGGSGLIQGRDPLLDEKKAY